ncbi:MAG: MFS transporter, partial [Phycisphaerales bacterium]|nr:MFS transporter [Phycisphaerales bacterium]
MTSLERRPGAFARATYGMRAIRSRKLQLLLLAQLTSQAGYFTFYVSQAWLALELTNSPGLVTMISTAGVAPFLFFAIPAGALADRANRRRLMISSRVLAVTAFTVEGVLVATGLVQPWHMLVVAFIAGIGIAIDNPAQFKSIADAVRPDEIPSASALVALDFQVSVILGPILGGLLLEAYGPAPGIFAAAAGNVALILCYIALRIPTTRGHTDESPWVGAVQGLKFVFTNRVVGLCALLWCVMILVINPYQALMSVFARDEVRTGGFG